MMGLSARIATLFNSPELSDVTFIFKKDEATPVTIYGHTFVLAVDSLVFEKMFYDNKSKIWTGKYVEIEMTENKERFFDSNAFLNFIKYIYTNNIAFPELTVETIVGIMYCAEYYRVPSVKTASGESLLERLNLDNVILLLETALRLKDLELEGKCWIIIKSSAQTVLHSAEILEAKMETLFEIIKRIAESIDESQVVDVCLKWSEKECERKGLAPTLENKRDVLGKIFFEMRTPFLPALKIAELKL